MKSRIQYILQKCLGYNTYLYVFAIFSIYRFAITKYDQEFAFFLKLIAHFKGNTIIDIGANIGVTSTLISKQFPHYSIWAFEPVHANFTTLKRVLRFFNINHVQLFNSAVGEKNAVIEMVTPIHKGVKKQGLSYIAEKDIADSADKIKELVTMTSLDELADQFSNNSVAAIKMDVENHELFVLRGGSQFLQKHRPLVYAELWENERKIPCIALLEGLGYSAYLLVDNKLVDYKGNHGLNYFFIPHEVSLTKIISLESKP